MRITLRSLVSALKSAIKSLYRLPIVGYFLRLAAAIVRLPQMRESHDSSNVYLISAVAELQRAAAANSALLADAAARINVQSLAIADAAARIDDQRAALAAREAAIHQRLELIDATLVAHGALISTVQRISNDVKTSITRDFAGVLNAVTIQQATTRSYAVGLESVDRRIHEVVRTQLANATDTVKRCEELATSVTAARAELSARAGAIQVEFATRVGAIERELAARAGAIEGELTKRALQIERVEGQMGKQPAALAQATVENLERSVKYLLERVEFVRRETLFEVRYGHAPGAEHPLDVKARVINAKKVAKYGKGGLRLNIGCGHIVFDEFVNVDRRELPGVDVVAEAGSLPFDPGTVAEIFAAHLLEHFPQEQLRREILPYWKKLLKKGGRVRAVVPDAQAMIREYGEGNMTYDDLREVTFGSQDYEGDFHYNMFTPESLAAILREAGFTNVEVTAQGRRNGQCFEFEVVAG